MLSNFCSLLFLYVHLVLSELLFECYSVPSVCYGVDALFSLLCNEDDGDGDGRGDLAARAALVVSMGFHTLHILPYIGTVQYGKKACPCFYCKRKFWSS